MAAAGIRIRVIGEVMASLFVTKRSGCNGTGENETTVTKYDETLSPECSVDDPVHPVPGVAESGHDIALPAESLVQCCGVELHLRCDAVLTPDALAALGGGRVADTGDVAAHT